MKYIYKVTYEQKFGREWYEYADKVIGGVDGMVVVEKVKKKCLGQALDDDLDCTGFRLKGLERDAEAIDY